jgi:hypothetical protein
MIDTIGIPTNWGIGALTKKAQSKYKNKKQFGDFNQVTTQLWKDTVSRDYISSGIDHRSGMRDEWLHNLANAASSIVKGNSMNNIVYHRSMPFDDRRHTPFLEDLSVLAQRSGMKSSHVVIVIRHPAATWLSHASSGDYGVFLKHIDDLLSKRKDYANTPITFVSYEKLLCQPETVLKKICSELNMECKAILDSPQIAAIARHLNGHNRNADYELKLEKYQKKWDAEKHNYPNVDKFIQDSVEECTSENYLQTKFKIEA